MTGPVRNRIDGISYLRREGDGRALPLLMLHGIGSNASTFTALLEQLPQDWDVICWDAPGYGGSDRLSVRNPVPQDYARRLEDFLAALGIARFNLLGHSLGALFATAHARLYPGKAMSLILLAPAEGYGIPADDPLPVKAQTRLDAVKRLGTAEFARQRAANLVFEPENSVETVDAVRQAMAGINIEGYRQAVRALSAGTLARAAANLALPSLVLVGVSDTVTPFAQGEGAHRGFVQKAPELLHVIKKVPQAGHALPQQRPALVAAEIRRFLKQVPQDGNQASHRTPQNKAVSKTTYNVPPVQRAIKLLRYVADGNDCANTSQAAKAVGINRTTLLRLLHTLAAENMIEPAGRGGGYRLGTGLISLASSAVFSRDLVQVAQPVLKQLAHGLGLSTHLGILDGQHIVYLVRETPNLHLVSNVRVGSRLPAHATTIGRSILAELDFDTVKTLFSERELVGVTSKTSVTYAALKAQLADDRSHGTAWSVGNFEANIGSCAAAIRDISGDVVGAINVTGPDHHFLADGGRRDEIAAGLIAAADRISRQLGYLPPQPAGGDRQDIVKDRRLS